jgi:hypothetical protein
MSSVSATRKAEAFAYAGEMFDLTHDSSGARRLDHGVRQAAVRLMTASGPEQPIDVSFKSSTISLGSSKALDVAT